MSWILALDASTPRSVLAIGRAGGPMVESSSEDDGANQASARLESRIVALFAAVGVGARELSAVACGRGPGTFTGTRVAVATAKGLALGLGVPIVPVSTLAAVAASVPDAGRIVPLLDARRGEVYGALFERNGDEVLARTDERCTTLADLLAAFALREPARLVGPGVAAAAEHLPAGWPTAAMPGPTPEGLWRAAASAHARGDAVDAAEIDAVYLRASYAELGVNTPKRKPFKSPFAGG
ncbi:MAG TPA: tRNA (adenosine(37)-N6)-threonylcarbamoyltransferase complex dimerization subunit type 1 TsaB [Nannocystaceae bacterium]|nr:tRNA (adenosine(37)-N6)-threonylcarbamoyltransferase complex dimerization subunit type 1 TsaB [Nannocystaceae bacterium]